MSTVIQMKGNCKNQYTLAERKDAERVAHDILQPRLAAALVESYDLYNMVYRKRDVEFTMAVVCEMTLAIYEISHTCSDSKGGLSPAALESLRVALISVITDTINASMSAAVNDRQKKARE